MTYPNLFSLVGNTPLVKLNSIFKNPDITVYAKLEGQNPGGSVKDRAAYNMIRSALERGEINERITLIEATSGNTGIALAMMAKQFNIAIELVMPENSTQERVDTMRAYGATVILTPAKETIEGSIRYVEEKLKKPGYFNLNQFGNKDNYLAHYKTTGPEIWKDTEGKITHFVSAMGTTGTIMGTSMYLKEQSKEVQIVGAQPLDGSSIPGIRKWSPEYLPKIFDASRVDKVIEVSEVEATQMARRLAKEEGIFAGMSSGGAVAVAEKLVETLTGSATIVSIICDRGDRYLSSDLFKE